MDDELKIFSIISGPAAPLFLPKVCALSTRQLQVSGSKSAPPARLLKFPGPVEGSTSWALWTRKEMREGLPHSQPPVEEWSPLGCAMNLGKGLRDVTFASRLFVKVLGRTCTFVRYCNRLTDSIGIVQKEAVCVRRRRSDTHRYSSVSQVWSTTH
jgi:hypothetical protein